ncbi:ABC transporter permease [Paenirhodobacter populi]|uniref:ABC transporter permease n=1 Tax=Paenirhodobacter populi TaxID=2306993 RepID=A0A443JCM0_9RHOB|nr:ABC transporter permease [Sinirhodobacter populi]RWR05347.1 ABC transporter permease [Sinirhodobacter populi]RWR15481.1 ABC transporter permease [Sinirhodobacter populi]RWR18103.1 ABC transporter permease [Sinirhodobacter populi]RWR28371.1 ABC transporter permease [Sinirhodobacter populi]
MQKVQDLPGKAPAAARSRPRSRDWPVRVACAFLVFILIVAVVGPFLTSGDPLHINAANRIKPPSAEHLFGTDAMGRDVFARVIYGARTSIIVGFVAALASLLLGLAVGLLAGYFPLADATIMRVMDGIMSIPSIVLAVALVAITGANLGTVLIAIIVPEFPRVVRLVRGVILSLRSEPYVEAAISLATPTWRILFRHMLPNTLAPLIVQGSFVLASAILTEAALSFLGVGLPPEIPSWGNIMAEGRTYFQLRPGLIFFPGIFLALTVLSINLIGDALRDRFDPKLEKRH